MTPHAHLVFVLKAQGLTPHVEYGATFEWQGQGGGISGSISNERADASGHVAFQLNPSILVAVGAHPAPGRLELSVTRADGSELDPSYSVSEPIA